MKFKNNKPRFRVAVGRSPYNLLGWIEVRLGPVGYFWKV